MASKKDVVSDSIFELDLTGGVDIDAVEDDYDKVMAKNRKELEEDVEDIFGGTEFAAPTPAKSKPKKATPVVEEEIDENDISFLITDIDDRVKYLTWCIYGKNGTGKTTLLSTTDGMLVLASEDGTLSIRDKSKGKAKKLRVDTWEKLEQVYWLLAQSPQILDPETNEIVGIEIPVKGGTFLVKSIGFDTADRLAEVCMRNVVLGEKAKDADKDILKKTLKNWGDMGEKMKFWLQQFEELPVQRIILCQEGSNSEDIDSDEFSIYPALNQGLRKYILSEADVIARLSIAKTDKGMQFRMSALPNSKYVTKDRTTRLSGIIANPNLDKLYSAVFK